MICIWLDWKEKRTINKAKGNRKLRKKMKYLHALLARDRENLQENPKALLLLTCKLAEHMLQTIILNTLPQSPRTGTGKSTKIIEKRFVTNTAQERQLT